MFKNICVTYDERHDFPASINEFGFLNFFFNRINRRSRAVVHGGGRFLMIGGLNFQRLSLHFATTEAV